MWERERAASGVESLCVSFFFFFFLLPFAWPVMWHFLVCAFSPPQTRPSPQVAVPLSLSSCRCLSPYVSACERACVFVLLPYLLHACSSPSVCLLSGDMNFGSNELQPVSLPENSCVIIPCPWRWTILILVLFPVQDNLNVFLKACGRLGLKEAQLFHPGDLQDLSTRVTVQ